MLRLYKFDLVILEHDIPLTNLPDAIKIIRKSAKDIPIIVLLDEYKKKKEDLFLHIKENFDYLIKPIDLEILKTKINDILYSIEMQKESEKQH